MDPIRQMLPLQDRTLYTLGQRRAFDVQHVDPDHSVAVVVRPHSSGIARNLLRREIEAGYEVAQRLPRGTLTPKRLLEEDPAQRNSAYVAALLREIGAN